MVTTWTPTPGFYDHVDHTLIIYGTIQIMQIFFYGLTMINLESYRVYDSEYGQSGTIYFYGPFWNIKWLGVWTFWNHIWVMHVWSEDYVLFFVLKQKANEHQN